MGIKGLYPLIKDEAPNAIKEGDIKGQFGRKVAIVSTYSPLNFENDDVLTGVQGCVCIIVYLSCSNW